MWTEFCENYMDDEDDVIDDNNFFLNKEAETIYLGDKSGDEDIPTIKNLDDDADPELTKMWLEFCETYMDDTVETINDVKNVTL